MYHHKKLLPNLFKTYVLFFSQTFLQDSVCEMSHLKVVNTHVKKKKNYFCVSINLHKLLVYHGNEWMGGFNPTKYGKLKELE